MNPPKANQPNAASSKRRARGLRHNAFTMVELLTVIVVIGILSSMVLFALFSVQETARAKRTKAQIAKIHELISGRWESYRTRPLPIRIPAGTSPRAAASLRLTALRQLMRIEMPEKFADVRLPAKSVNSPLHRTYRLRLTPEATRNFEGAECLYMILATIQDGDTNGLDFFREHETGDVDKDGMPEILDGWGQPIAFIRWAPGFYNLNADTTGDGNADYITAVSTLQFGDLKPGVGGDAGKANGDPFDPLKVDQRWNNKNTKDDPFGLFPLIYSIGPDGQGGILTTPTVPGAIDDPFDRHGIPNLENPPGGATEVPRGYIRKENYAKFVDNISNHMLEAR